MKKYLVLLITIISFTISNTTYAGMATTDSSTIRGPSSVSSKLQCTTFNMNGRNIGYNTANSQNAYNSYMTAADSLRAMNMGGLADLLIATANYVGYANLSSVYDPSNCTTITTTNTGMTANVTFVLLTGGGDIGIMCPPAYPYYQSYNETWGAGLGNGTIVPSVQCCKVPPNRVQNKTDWTNYTPDSNFSGDGVCNDYTYP